MYINASITITLITFNVKNKLDVTEVQLLNIYKIEVINKNIMTPTTHITEIWLINESTDVKLMSLLFKLY